MSSSLAKRIGRNLASARKAKGRTQAQVAEKAGLDTVSLSRIERGIVAPSLATLDKLAEELGAPLGSLLDGTSARLPTLTEAIGRELEPLSDEDRLFLLGQLQLWAQKLRDCRKQ